MQSGGEMGGGLLLGLDVILELLGVELLALCQGTGSERQESREGSGELHFGRPLV